MLLIILPVRALLFIDPGTQVKHNVYILKYSEIQWLLGTYRPDIHHSFTDILAACHLTSTNCGIHKYNIYKIIITKS